MLSRHPSTTPLLLKLYNHLSPFMTNLFFVRFYYKNSMVKIWEIYGANIGQNMVHKLVIKWERFAQQKSWAKYGT